MKISLLLFNDRLVWITMRSWVRFFENLSILKIFLSGLSGTESNQVPQDSWVRDLIKQVDIKYMRYGVFKSQMCYFSMGWINNHTR